MFPYLPGLSCKDIKDSHTDIISGKYWVDPSNTRDPFPVFCDMETDGGKNNTLKDFDIKGTLLNII